MGMVEIPVQRLEQEEQELLRAQEVERQRVRRLREAQQSQADQMWPRRKRSDLMAHLAPSVRTGPRVARDPAPAPAPVKAGLSAAPVKKVAAKGAQDAMWPRRRKSDLLIYQMTRMC